MLIAAFCNRQNTLPKYEALRELVLIQEMALLIGSCLNNLLFIASAFTTIPNKFLWNSVCKKGVLLRFVLYFMNSR